MLRFNILAGVVCISSAFVNSNGQHVGDSSYLAIATALEQGRSSYQPDIVVPEHSVDLVFVTTRWLELVLEDYSALRLAVLLRCWRGVFRAMILGFEQRKRPQKRKEEWRSVVHGRSHAPSTSYLQHPMISSSKYSFFSTTRHTQNGRGRGHTFKEISPSGISKDPPLTVVRNEPWILPNIFLTWIDAELIMVGL